IEKLPTAAGSGETELQAKISVNARCRAGCVIGGDRALKLPIGSERLFETAVGNQVLADASQRARNERDFVYVETGGRVEIKEQTVGVWNSGEGEEPPA